MKKDESWPPFEPFEQPASPALPAEALPAVVRNYVCAIAGDLQVFPDMVALMVLAVLAAGLVAKFEVEPKLGWREVLTLFVVGLACSGERKTPVVRGLTSIVMEYEKQVRDLCVDAVAKSRAAADVIQSNIKAAKGDPVALAAAYTEQERHKKIVTLVFVSKIRRQRLLRTG